MTRKHFELIAKALAEAKPTAFDTGPLRGANLHRHAGWETATRAVADALKATNPAFKRETFEKACGL